MDIHKPKPWHGIREFLKEYVIIVVGVVTALIGEQAVETLHWRHVAESTREGMVGGLTRLLHDGGERDGQSECLATEFRNLRGVLARASETGQLDSVAQVRSPMRRAWSFNFYDTIVSGQLLPHLSVDERTVVVSLNGWSQYLQRNREVEVRDWTVLRGLEGPGRRIGEAELAAQRAALNGAIQQGSEMRGAARQLAQQIVNTHFLSSAVIAKAWAEGRADGQRIGACETRPESSTDTLLRQFETPIPAPPTADLLPKNWPGFAG